MNSDLLSFPDVQPAPGTAGSEDEGDSVLVWRRSGRVAEQGAEEEEGERVGVSLDEGVVGEEGRRRGVAEEEVGVGEERRGGREGEEEVKEFAGREGMEGEGGCD